MFENIPVVISYSSEDDNVWNIEEAKKKFMSSKLYNQQKRYDISLQEYNNVYYTSISEW